MNTRSQPLLRQLTLTTLTVALGTAVVVHAQSPAAPNAAAQPSAAKVAAAAASAAAIKDVVLDTPSAPAAASTAGRLVATPRLAQTPAAAPPIYTSPLHDAAAASALADLGLQALRQQSRDQGQANFNAAVSPLSIAVALGLVHAGAAGQTQRDLSTVLSSAAAGGQGFGKRLPSLLSRLGAADQPVFTMANRLWLRRDVAPQVPAPYLATVRARFGADAVSIAFDQGDSARLAINAWTADHTRKRITELLPAGSITAATKLVATNAIHFKSPWAQPFDAAATKALPFQVPGGSKPVPTMVDERLVRHGTVDELSVLELPFANRAYALMIAMPPGKHTMDGLEQDLAGLDMAAWSSQLKESVCQLQLPRFHIDAPAISLKAMLQGIGVQQAFTDRAELQPLLGAAAVGVGLEDVFHRATVTIDEAGGEAAAATAVTAQAKSFAMPAPTCAVDRPFVFAIVHKPTGTPLFVGKVVDPGTRAKE